MQYMGSKRRFVKDLLPIMLESRKEGQYWVEPFVGGANMIRHVDGNRIGADVHEYLIALLKAVRDGWKPPTEVSCEMHRDVRINKQNYPFGSGVGIKLKRVIPCLCLRTKPLMILFV